MKDYVDFICGKVFFRLRAMALQNASDEQGITNLRNKLEQLVPDITDQYSMFKVADNYLKIKVRNLHAFQISLLTRVIDRLKNKITIVDIGDSAGTHLQYIKGLFSGDKDIECLSINLDIKAINRIKSKGLKAIHGRAEDVEKYNMQPDIFLCFELLEHLKDPIGFLYNLSKKTNAKFIIVTVPYVRKSRIGLRHIKEDNQKKRFAENTHIFELCPEDWKLLIKHSGWRIAYEKIYLQYPEKSLLNFSKMLWGKFDFEGFYGAILEKDDTWSSIYCDWEEK